MDNRLALALCVVIGATGLSLGWKFSRELERVANGGGHFDRIERMTRQIMAVREESVSGMDLRWLHTGQLVSMCKKAGFIRPGNEVFETDDYFVSNGVFGIMPTGDRPQLMIIHIDDSGQTATLVFSNGRVMSMPLRPSGTRLDPDWWFPT